MYTNRCLGHRSACGQAGQLHHGTAACRQRLQHTSVPLSRHAGSPLQLGISSRAAWLQQQQRRSRPLQTVQATTEAWPSLQKRSRLRYIAKLNFIHGIQDFVEFYPSENGLPAAYLMHPRGHTLEIHLQGATITRWLREDGTDLLFTRSDAEFEKGVAINSGIPLAFPQWRDGPLPYNGFADKLQWEVVGADLDGEFTNTMVGKEDFAAGRARLSLDAEGNATVPKPLGLIDEEDDAALDAEADADLSGDALDAMYDEDDAAADAAAATAAKKKRGKKSNAEKEAEKAAAEAAAAEEADAAAVAEEGEAASAAAGSSSGSDEEEGLGEAVEDQGLEEGQQDGWQQAFGVIEDPAPYIILKLKDTAETRAIWPHKFELYYKITLMESDDFPDPKEGLPKGIHPYTGSTRPRRPEHEALLEALDEGDEETAAALAAAAEAAEERDLARTDDSKAGFKSYNSYRMFTDEDGQVVDEEEDGIAAVAAAVAGGAAAEGSSIGRGRKKKAAAADEDAGADGAAAAAAVDDEDADLPRDLYDPPEEAMQVKMEWRLINNDAEGSPPMSFQLGALSHFRTKDQQRYGELVRILGLGGVVTFDYSADPRKARLDGNSEDYITFEGQRHETVFIDSHDADVMFCPGTRTHFELMARKGLVDHVVWHPGALGLPGLETEPRFFAQVGAGRIALPKKLAPGDMWKGEYVIRWHPRYWDPPVFDRDGAQPMPQLYPRADDADDDDKLDTPEAIEGLTSSKLGGGADVPYLDE